MFNLLTKTQGPLLMPRKEYQRESKVQTPIYVITRSLLLVYLAAKIINLKEMGSELIKGIMIVFSPWFSICTYISTIKQHCSAGMTLMLTEDKKSLEIKVINEDHNHIVCKVVHL